MVLRCRVWGTRLGIDFPQQVCREASLNPRVARATAPSPILSASPSLPFFCSFLPFTRLTAATFELQPKYPLLQEALPEPLPQSKKRLLCTPTPLLPNLSLCAATLVCVCVCVCVCVGMGWGSGLPAAFCLSFQSGPKFTDKYSASTCICTCW